MKHLMLVLLGIGLVMAVAGASRAAEQAEVVYQLGGLKVLGDAPHYLDLGAGGYGAFHGGNESAAGTLQLRFGNKLSFIGPALGVMANVDGGAMAYAALYAELAVGRLVFTPLIGFGAYEAGDSKDLGGVLQFSDEIGVAYQFANRSRLGLRFVHISNAEIHDKNPGVDSLYLTFAIPF
ncbi:hypothetical protein DESUT3_04400 [Desulfuromonas versatilis]|uniref:Acyloxyacyl hydrolase n=1 Tax=Desulfuromonas versatilis TaxID=2802975 RepID=A0ABM8HP82_9BACT|nr:acyloxyacyl hydrolase [Desulfuromonas versatilis]BCR03371.1 hypothetical protein DESUT3_04400 [Desulfuromonas versatilis]